MLTVKGFCIKNLEAKTIEYYPVNLQGWQGLSYTSRRIGVNCRLSKRMKKFFGVTRQNTHSSILFSRKDVLCSLVPITRSRTQLVLALASCFILCMGFPGRQCSVQYLVSTFKPARPVLTFEGFRNCFCCTLSTHSLYERWIYRKKPPLG